MTANEIVNLPDVWIASMRKYGISARSVASKAGVNLPHFYHVLHKKSSPTLEYAAKIATVIAEEIQERESISIGDPQLKAMRAEQMHSAVYVAEQKWPTVKE